MQLKLRSVIPHKCSEMQRLCLPRTEKIPFLEYCMFSHLLGFFTKLIAVLYQLYLT